MKAALLFVLCTLGCAADQAATTTASAAVAEGGDVELRTIASGGYAAAKPPSPKAIAVRSAEEYRRTWDQTIGGGEPPQVDFARESVVILLAGEKPSGGYSIDVRGATLDGRTLVVDAKVKSPPPDSMVTMAFTSPFVVVAVNSKDFDDVRWTP